MESGFQTISSRIEMMSRNLLNICSKNEETGMLRTSLLRKKGKRNKISSSHYTEEAKDFTDHS